VVNADSLTPERARFSTRSFKFLRHQRSQQRRGIAILRSSAALPAWRPERIQDQAAADRTFGLFHRRHAALLNELRHGAVHPV
jgi:hypothetical protein